MGTSDQPLPAEQMAWERRGWAGEAEPEQPDRARGGTPSGTLVYPGWGNAPAYAMAPSHLSRASTVQVLGIFSLVTLPVFGLGMILAVFTLATARSVRRELHAAGGRGPGGREVTVGTTCAWIALGLGSLFVVACIMLLAFLVAGSLG